MKLISYLFLDGNTHNRLIDRYECKEVAKYSKSGLSILNKLKFMQTMTHPVNNVLSGLYKRDIKCKTTCVDRIAALLYPKLM